MIGVVFLVIALVFGKIGISFLSAIPNAVLGILLVFAGLELALMIRDMEEKNDFFVAILIAGIGFATTNMGIAFFVGHCRGVTGCCSTMLTLSELSKFRR
ncbi:MAG: hypothetical protein DRI57_10210 [Deltaproteobacteria bacterium]|nr:MAG: hypothetical protein DRI57_10210 [Deltaproteobacteria bacterium]